MQGKGPRRFGGNRNARETAGTRPETGPGRRPSVRRRQDRPGLGMVHHVLAQQVILLGAGLGKLARTERQVAIREQADRDPESIRPT